MGARSEEPSLQSLEQLLEQSMYRLGTDLMVKVITLEFDIS